MPAKIDVTGHKYGRLTVLGESDILKYGRLAWDCICECGKKVIISSCHLRYGKVKSCGCYGKEARRARTRKPEGVAAFKQLWWAYTKEAKNRGKSFTLSEEYFKREIQLPCHYCGSASANVKTPARKETTGNFIYTGLDRMDNTKGYEIGNVVPCCKPCNFAKGTRSYSEFQNWIKKISDFRDFHISSG